MKVSERQHLIHAIEAKDYGSAGIDADSINMGLLHRVCFVFTFGALTGNSILKFYSGASQGTKTTALAYSYRYAGGDYKAASADLPGAATAVASTGLTLTAATYDHRLVIVEFEGNQMTDAEPWLTAEIDSTASVMTVGACAIGDPRYAANVQPTTI